MIVFVRRRSHVVTLGLAAGLLSLACAGRAQAEAQLLIEASTGKVLHAENATYPWYPASVTKLMTAYTTLRAIKEGRIALNTLFTVSRNAAAQQPTKMGFKIGATVTVDNALKMLMVKSANDIAVTIAEGVGGSLEGFADLMNANALSSIRTDCRRKITSPPRAILRFWRAHLFGNFPNTTATGISRRFATAIA